MYLIGLRKIKTKYGEMFVGDSDNIIVKELDRKLDADDPDIPTREWEDKKGNVHKQFSVKMIELKNPTKWRTHAIVIDTYKGDKTGDNDENIPF